MKKTFLLALLMVLLTPWALRADEVVIGDEAATTTEYTVPVNMYYHYSLVQQIYLADEIGTAGSISAISFDYTYSSAFSMDNIQVFMVNTDKAEFASTTDMEAISDGDKVYEGTFSADAAGWVTITLDLPFEYDGTSNLLICFYDPENGYPGSAFKFGTTAVADGTYLGLAYYSDSYTPSLADVSTFSGSKSRYTYRNTIMLEITPDGGGVVCEKPSALDVAEITVHEASLGWADGSGTYNLEIKKQSESDWTRLLTASEDFSYDLTGLDPLTAYSVRVQSVCDDTIFSGWKSASFTTAAGMPLVETFDASSIPSGWRRYTGLLDAITAGTATLTPASSGWNFGERYIMDSHAYVNIWGTDCNKWLVMPEMFIEENAQLTFDLALTDYNNANPIEDPTAQADDRFIVLASMDGGESWEVLRQWDNQGSEDVYNEITNASAGQAVVVDLSGYADQNITLAFYGESTASGGDNDLHIDNVRVDFVPLCERPMNLAVIEGSATETSIDLEWTDDAASTWLLQYKKSGVEEWTSLAEEVTENPFTLEGLDASSTYQVRIAAWCDPSDSATISQFSNPISFATECGVVLVDADNIYIENFDSYTASAGVLPNCWNRINTCSYSSYDVTKYPRIYANSSSSTYAHSAPNCLYLYSYYSSYSDYDPQPQYAILPEMSGIDDKQLTAWIRGYNASSTVKVGRMDDPADATTFHLIAEQDLTTSYAEYTFDLSQATGDYVAFMIDAASSSRTTNGVYIDNIVIENPPACPKPSAPSVAEISGHTAKLSWTAGAVEAAWQIMLNGDAENLIEADTNTFVLTGLAAETRYVAKVRANCGDEQSEWANDSVVFTTMVACPAPDFSADSIKSVGAHSADLVWGGYSDSYIVSYRTAAYVDGMEEGFEDAGSFANWQAFGVVSTNMDSRFGRITSAKHTGDYGFSFSSYSSATDYNQYLISPQLSTGGNLKFFYKASTSSGTEVFKVGYSSTGDAVSDFTWGNQITASTAWTQFSDTVPAGTQYIAINYCSNYQYQLFIDDIALGEPVAAGEWVIDNAVAGNSKQLTGLTPETKYEVKIQGNCGDEGLSRESDSIVFITRSEGEIPYDIAITYAGGLTAEISWSGNVSEYNLDVNGVVTNNVTSPYTLSNLSLATTYEVKLQSICTAGGTSGWSSPISFSTDICEPEDQCLLTFELTDAWGDGWNGAAIKVVDVVSGIVIAEMANENLNGTQGSGEDELNVKTLAVCNEREIQFSWENGSYDGEASYVVKDVNGEVIFSGSGAMSAPVDYVVSCVSSSCRTPENLSVTEIGPHSVQLGWTELGEATAWVVAYKLGAEENFTEVNAVTNSYLLENLIPDTSYVVKVRSVCSDEVIKWSAPVVFTTLVACPAPLFSQDSIQNILATSADLVWGGFSDSYIVSYRTAAYVDGVEEGFEDESSYSNWTVSNLASGSGVTTAAAHSGSYGFSFKWTSNPPQYLISPAITGLAAGATLQFYYKNYSSSYPETFQVGYSSTDNEVASFTFGDEITVSDVQWHLFSEVVPAGTMYFCIKCTSDNQYYLYVDDIMLGEAVEAGEWVIDNAVSGNSLQLTDLTPETKYDVKIQGNCGDEGLSAETAILTFRTISNCQTPTAVEVLEVGLDSVVLSWNGYGLTEFNLRYSDDAENWIVMNDVTIPCVIRGLNPSTVYAVQVQATCDTEKWSIGYTFSTKNGIPFAEADADGIVRNWYTYKKLASDVFDGQELSGSGNWSIAAADDLFEGSHYKLNIYGGSCKDWLVSPSIDATNVQLAADEKLKLGFTMALAKWNGSGSLATVADTTGIDDKFIVVFSIDDGETWSEANATVWDNAGSPNVFNDIPNTGVDILLDFSAGAGHVMRIAFYGESTLSNADNNIFIGNILLDVVGNTTDIRGIDATEGAVKIVKEGHFYILRDGVIYDATGRKIK